MRAYSHEGYHENYAILNEHIFRGMPEPRSATDAFLQPWTIRDPRLNEEARPGQQMDRPTRAVCLCRLDHYAEPGPCSRRRSAGSLFSRDRLPEGRLVPEPGSWR